MSWVVLAAFLFDMEAIVGDKEGSTNGANAFVNLINICFR